MTLFLPFATPSYQKQLTLSSSKKDITEKAAIKYFEMDWAVKQHNLKE